MRKKAKGDYSMKKELKAYALNMGPAKCAVDLSDGSERGDYVGQDYILNVLGRPMRAVNLMTSYYPLDKTFPKRARNAFEGMELHSAWDYPYDDYETYKGGLVGRTDEEPFNWMKEVRSHGQDVILTITMDPHIGDEHLVAIAKDLYPYGRLLLRINHEASGSWFSFNKRASHKEVSDFFAHVCEVFHREAPHIKLILCLDGYKDLEEEKMEKEDDFISAIKAADIFSVDRYLALHWGWPYDVALKGGNSFARYSVKGIYELTKKSCKRYNKIAGEKRPMVLSELNADGDVTGPYEQAAMFKEFCDYIKEDKDKWLNGFTFYQFRDEGRLGLEINDPNNKNVGIKQPVMDTFKEVIEDDYFKPSIKKGKQTKLPVKLRWGGSEDAEGLSVPISFERKPVYCELYFEDELESANLMLEFNGRWFYKAPGTKFIDLMPALFENPIKGKTNVELKIFAPPADGKNDPSQGKDWMINYYYQLKTLPRIRIEYLPVASKKRK